MPSVPPSRPRPDCLMPPNGAAASEITPMFSPIMPDSRVEAALAQHAEFVSFRVGESHKPCVLGEHLGAKTD